MQRRIKQSDGYRQTFHDLNAFCHRRAEVTRTFDEVIGTATTGFDLLSYLEFSRVIGIAIIVASVEIILVSLLATLFAIMYNVTVGLTGGIEVVLSDDA